MSELYRYHKPITKPVYCVNASTLGYGKWKASRGDVVVFTDTYHDGSEQRSIGRVLALATHDGTGKRFEKTGPRGGVRAAPQLLVLVFNETMTHAYERIVDPESIRQVLAPTKAHAAFAAWLMGGELPSTESVLGAVRYGAVSSSYFAKYADDAGDLREDWREVDRIAG